MKREKNIVENIGTCQRFCVGNPQIAFLNSFTSKIENLKHVHTKNKQFLKEQFRNRKIGKTTSKTEGRVNDFRVAILESHCLYFSCFFQFQLSFSDLAQYIIIYKMSWSLGTKTNTTSGAKSSSTASNPKPHLPITRSENPTN